MGTAFKKPSQAVMRRHRAAGGEKMFSAGELRTLLDDAGDQLRAMILLGINAAYQNSDVQRLTIRQVEEEPGWLSGARGKTGIKRRAKLWPETQAALRAVLRERRKPVQESLHGDLVFVTSRGNQWRSTAISFEMGNLLKKHDINGRRGLNFSALRHTFRTVADSTRDFPAVLLVMGHADGSISNVYRERIDDDRLEAVAEYVRAWLFT